MKKSIIKKIEAEADKLPVKLEAQNHTEYFTGAEAMKAQEQYGGTKIKFNPKTTYPSKTPVMREVNHRERMKDAYKIGGWDAVNKYIAANSGDGEVVSTAPEE